jgi:hypothetical protein
MLPTDSRPDSFSSGILRTLWKVDLLPQTVFEQSDYIYSANWRQAYCFCIIFRQRGHYLTDLCSFPKKIGFFFSFNSNSIFIDVKIKNINSIFIYVKIKNIAIFRLQMFLNTLIIFILHFLGYKYLSTP